MEILGIGPLEFMTILLIMLIVLGPKDMIKTGRQLGMFIRKVVRSSAWQSMMSASREIREMPTRLVRESGFEEDVEELKKISRFPKEEISSLNRLADEAFYSEDPSPGSPKLLEETQNNNGNKGNSQVFDSPLSNDDVSDDAK